jgi:hypothetical protein
MTQQYPFITYPPTTKHLKFFPPFPSTSQKATEYKQSSNDFFHSVNLIKSNAYRTSGPSIESREEDSPDDNEDNTGNKEPEGKFYFSVIFGLLVFELYNVHLRFLQFLTIFAVHRVGVVEVVGGVGHPRFYVGYAVD